jgi:hypothetical protein
MTKTLPSRIPNKALHGSKEMEGHQPSLNFGRQHTNRINSQASNRAATTHKEGLQRLADRIRLILPGRSCREYPATQPAPPPPPAATSAAPPRPRCAAAASTAPAPSVAPRPKPCTDTKPRLNECLTGKQTFFAGNCHLDCTLTWGRRGGSGVGRQRGSGWLRIVGRPQRRVGRRSGDATPWTAGDEEEGELAAARPCGF